MWRPALIPIEIEAMRSTLNCPSCGELIETSTTQCPHCLRQNAAYLSGCAGTVLRMLAGLYLLAMFLTVAVLAGRTVPWPRIELVRPGGFSVHAVAILAVAVVFSLVILRLAKGFQRRE